MANLETIKALNKQYRKDTPISRVYNSDNLIKGFENFSAFSKQKLVEAFSKQISGLGHPYVRYFEEGLPAEVALLYIDICSFSTRFSKLSGREIGELFDEYYDLVIPIIYDNEGEIDKIMGDGIICSFGPPFYNENLSNCLTMADHCAKEIILATRNTKFASKVAFHAGTINYFKNKSGLYNEYTMIGKPLTELYRLESISENSTISFFDDTPVRKHNSLAIVISDSYRLLNQESTLEFDYVKTKIKDLKGVKYDHIYTMLPF